MSFEAVLWALEDAPVASPTEKLVLLALATRAGSDGCNAYPPKSKIADIALLDEKVVQKTLGELRRRGLIKPGNQAVAAHIPRNRRPVVYDLMIPYSWYGPVRIRKINEERERLGLPPLTPEDRPDLGEAPPRKHRADKGVPRKKGGADALSEDPHGGGPVSVPDDFPVDIAATGDHASDQAEQPGGVFKTPQTETADENQGGLEDPPRGVSETPPGGSSRPPIQSSNTVLVNSPSHTPPLRGGACDARTRTRTREDGPSGGETTSGHGNPDGTLLDAAPAPEAKPGPKPLPRDWRPSPELIQWAKDTYPDLDDALLDEMIEEFVRYWAVEAPARDPKSPRARKPKSWEKVDWEATFRNRVHTQARRFGMRRRTAAAKPQGPQQDAQVPLFDDGELDRKAAEVAEWWINQCRKRGPVLSEALGKATKLVRAALEAGATQRQAYDALVACGEPVPPMWAYQRALLGQPPRGAAAGQRRDEDADSFRRMMRAAELDRMMDESGGMTDEEIFEYLTMQRLRNGARAYGYGDPDAYDVETTSGNPIRVRGEISQ